MMMMMMIIIIIIIIIMIIIIYIPSCESPKCRVQSKMHIGNTFKNDIKHLDPKKAYKYLSI